MYMKMRNFEDFKQELFQKRPGVKKAYDELEPEYVLIAKLIEQRLSNKLSQAAIAKKMGTKQSAISRFEAGNSNPTMAFLYKLADALDVKIKFSITS